MISSARVKLRMACVAVVLSAAFALVASRAGSTAARSLVASRAGGYASVLVAAAAVHLALDRATWLPFLGETALPASVLRSPDAIRDGETTTVTVRGLGGAKAVAYWAALSGDPSPSPEAAYGDFSNAGVARVDADGTATLSVACPRVYVGRAGQTNAKHVHYRAFYSDGTAGAVRTAPLACV